jgi:hypothetical protein
VKTLRENVLSLPEPKYGERKKSCLWLTNFSAGFSLSVSLHCCSILICITLAGLSEEQAGKA